MKTYKHTEYREKQAGIMIRRFSDYRELLMSCTLMFDGDGLRLFTSFSFLYLHLKCVLREQRMLVSK